MVQSQFSITFLKSKILLLKLKTLKNVSSAQYWDIVSNDLSFFTVICIKKITN